MENSKVKEESVQKYFEALVQLRNVLKYTTRISLDGFCTENNLSKNLPTVLKKGGVITCITKGKYSEWTWNTIEPTKQMAVKSIQMLGQLNPPRKPRVKQTKVILNKRGGARPNSGRPKKIVIENEVKDNKLCNVKNKNISFSIFWGLIKFNFNK